MDFESISNKVAKAVGQGFNDVKGFLAKKGRILAASEKPVVEKDKGFDTDIKVGKINK